MTNSNNTEARARINSRTGTALFEVSTFDGGVVIITPKKVSRDDLPVQDRKVKDGTVPNA